MVSLSLRAAALAVGALVTAFWLWFGIASAIGEGLGMTSGILHVIVPGGILLATMAVAWKWETLGGALFALEGLVVAIGYPFMARGRFPIATVILMLLTLALPPLAAGAMLLVDVRRLGPRH